MNSKFILRCRLFVVVVLNNQVIVNDRSIACNHRFQDGDTLWVSNTSHEVYCHKCATLLQFSECIRKYVLETENDEVIDYTWPWYRNHFHREDANKYRKYIAKYNLTHLFTTRDVVPDYGLDHKDADLLELRSFLKRLELTSYYKSFVEHHGIRNMDELYQASDYDLEHKLGVSYVDHRQRILAALHKWKHPDIHIRHVRKFAASVLLGPFDILRNLQVIRNQLEQLFLSKYIHEQPKRRPGHRRPSSAVSFKDDARTALNGRHHGKRDHYLPLDLPDSWMKKEEKEGWEQRINKINENLWERLQTSTEDALFGSTRKSPFMTDENEHKEHRKKRIENSLFNAILSEDVKDNDVQFDTDHDDEDERWYRAFKRSFRKTPRWWGRQHDLLLLDLSLRFNWDRESIRRELSNPSKKPHNQELLKKKKKVNQQLDVEPIYDSMEQMIQFLEQMFKEVNQQSPLRELKEYRQDILQWFHDQDCGIDEWPPMEKPDFINAMQILCTDADSEAVQKAAGRLFNVINMKVNVNHIAGSSSSSNSNVGSSSEESDDDDDRKENGSVVKLPDRCTPIQ